MKVKAFLCDYGNHLAHEDACFGLVPIEDVFDIQLSYPIVNDPDKSDIHICTDCYRIHVTIPAGNAIDRRKEERLYELKIKELSYDFRKKAVLFARDRIRAHVKKSKKSSK